MEEVVDCLPQALVQVDATCRIRWCDPGLVAKLGAGAEEGSDLSSLLGGLSERDTVRWAVMARQSCTVEALYGGRQPVRVQVRPCREDAGAWLVLEPSTEDDDLAVAHALHEIARAVGETLDVAAVCTAAVMAIIRCPRIVKAEVYLVQGGGPLRKVASGGERFGAPSAVPEGELEGMLFEAVQSGQPQTGYLSRREGMGPVLAVIPMTVQRRTVGLLLLQKSGGATFTLRETDLWAAAAGQLGVTLESARLLLSAQDALRAREEFMSIASHELRTPLTPLKMNLFMMERAVHRGQPVSPDALEKARRQVDRLAGLVNDLLDASRIDLRKLAVRATPLELGALVREVAEDFQLATGRAFRVRSEPQAAGHWISGDRDRLEQVLVNLLENAQKYSPASAAVEVTLGHDGGQVVLRVRDQGIGIPAAELPHIFQRFYRAKNSSHRHFGGLGLGLFITESIVRLHGGTLSVQSEEGTGSTFTVHLPKLARIPAGELAAASAS